MMYFIFHFAVSLRVPRVVKHEKLPKYLYTKHEIAAIKCDGVRALSRCFRSGLSSAVYIRLFICRVMGHRHARKYRFECGSVDG